jgi:hypothetical protein
MASGPVNTAQGHLGTFFCLPLSVGSEENLPRTPATITKKTCFEFCKPLHLKVKFNHSG